VIVALCTIVVLLFFLFTVLYKVFAPVIYSDMCLTFIDSHVWICLLCKLPFQNRGSYELHQRVKHTTPGSSYKHSCGHCGRRFRQPRQLELHKCRPQNFACNVQKEIRLQNCRRFNAATVEYIGPTFVRVQRHDDILAIVGDVFTHTDENGEL